MTSFSPSEKKLHRFNMRFWKHMIWNLKSSYFSFTRASEESLRLMMVVGIFPSKMMTKLQKIVSQIDIILCDFFKSTPFLVWKLGSMNLLHAEDMMNQQFFSLFTVLKTRWRSILQMYKVCTISKHYRHHHCLHGDHHHHRRLPFPQWWRWWMMS